MALQGSMFVLRYFLLLCIEERVPAHPQRRLQLASARDKGQRWATCREGCCEAVGRQVKLINTGRAGETCPDWQGITRLHFWSTVSTFSRAAMLLGVGAGGF